MGGWDIADLDTWGFVVMRGFLSDDVLTVLRDDFAAAPLDPELQLSTALAVRGGRRAADATDRGRAGRRHGAHALRVDLPVGANYFATGGLQRLASTSCGTRITRATS